MKKTSLILLSLLVLPLFAGAFEGPFDNRGERRLVRWMAILNTPELNLSQAQKDKIFDIILNTEKSINSILTELMKAEYEKQKELSSNTPNWNKVKSYNDQISKLRSNIMKTRLDAEVDILSILTQDQRDKLKELTKRKSQMQCPMPSQMREGKYKEMPKQPE